MSELRLVASRYQIVHIVGQGGMGAVYRARDLESDRDVALKEMRVEGDERTRQIIQHNFVKEAEALEKISHPGIPRIWNHFEEGDSLFLVMEFIEGVDIKRWIKEYQPMTGTQLPQKTIADYALQICDILRYLHQGLERPIMHRDLKPSNLILQTDRGRIVLVDFGLARTVDAGTRSITANAGSPGYAPMEQVRGQAEPRSDIYALGATLYFMLTAKNPSSTRPSVPRAVNTNIDEALSNLVEKATQTDPDRRFASVTQMETALRQLLPGLDKPAAEVSKTFEVQGGPKSPERRRFRKLGRSSEARRRSGKSSGSRRIGRFSRPRKLGAGHIALTRSDLERRLDEVREQRASVAENDAIVNNREFLEGEGVRLLQQQNYPAAMVYFKRKVKESPQDCEGWLGVGAVNLVTGSPAEGLECLVKGSRGVSHSYGGELLAAADVGAPEEWLKLAQVAAGRRHPPALICALSLVEACLLAPDLPRQVYARASRDYRSYLAQLHSMRYKFADEAGRHLDPSYLVSSQPRHLWAAALALILIGLLYGIYAYLHHQTPARPQGLIPARRILTA